MIGIIGALEPEISIIKNNMSDVTKEEVLGSVFYRGLLLKQNVVVSQCSIGKVNAAITASAMIMKYRPNLIINTGIAGSLSSKVKIMDVVVADKISIHDEGEVFKRYYPFITSFSISNDFVDMVKSAYCEIYKKLDDIHIGEVITGDDFINNNIKKENLKIHFNNSLAVDMECGAIGKVCYRSKTHLAVIKTISDEADNKAKINYDDFLNLAAQKSSSVVLGLLLKLQL